jgi:hypothetical protein
MYMILVSQRICETYFSIETRPIYLHRPSATWCIRFSPRSTCLSCIQSRNAFINLSGNAQEDKLYLGHQGMKHVE